MMIMMMTVIRMRMMVTPLHPIQITSSRSRAPVCYLLSSEADYAILAGGRAGGGDRGDGGPLPGGATDRPQDREQWAAWGTYGICLC
jgi:hypothetical protein